MKTLLKNKALTTLALCAAAFIGCDDGGSGGDADAGMGVRDHLRPGALQLLGCAPASYLT